MSILVFLAVSLSRPLRRFEKRSAGATGILSQDFQINVTANVP